MNALLDYCGRILTLICATCFLLPIGLVHAGEGDKLGAERIQAAHADALAAIRKVLGEEASALPAARIATSAELAKAVALENLPMLRLRIPDEAGAKAQADLAGSSASSRLIAKYAWSTKELLVVPGNWQLNAKLFPKQRLLDDDVLRAVIVHELCHALDDKAHDFTAMLLKASTVDAANAVSAIIEGHAQHQARKICAQAGWSDGFERYTGIVGALPEGGPDMGEAVKMVLSARAREFGFAYHEGERFVAAIEKAGGAKALDEMFRRPPADAEEILSPEWYLDPKKRPATVFELEPALDRFAGGYDPKIWTATRMGLNGQQLAAGLAMLEPADRDKIQKSMRGARFVQLVPSANPTSKIAILVAMEFASEDAAQHFVEQSAKLSRMKDEAMTRGLLRIVSSSSGQVELVNGKGWIHEKRMVNGTLEFPVSSMNVHRGRIVIETTFSGDPPSREEQLKLVDELLLLPRRKQS